MDNPINATTTRITIPARTLKPVLPIFPTPFVINPPPRDGRGRLPPMADFGNGSAQPGLQTQVNRAFVLPKPRRRPAFREAGGLCPAKARERLRALRGHWRRADPPPGARGLPRGTSCLPFAAGCRRLGCLWRLASRAAVKPAPSQAPIPRLALSARCGLRQGSREHGRQYSLAMSRPDAGSGSRL